MNFYGNYLLSKNIVSKEQLCKALSYQTKKSSGYLGHLVEKKYIPKNKLISILKLRDKNNTTILESIDKIGLLSNECLDCIKNYQLENKIPLGQILIELFDLDRNLLAEELINFNSEYKKNIEKNEFNFSFNNIDEKTQGEYLKLLKDEKKSSIENELNRLKKDLKNSSEEDIRSDFEILLESFKSLHASANFARAEVSSLILSKIIIFIEGNLDLIKNLNEDEIDKFIHSICRAIDVVWEIRTFLYNCKNEKEYWENLVSRENYFKVIDKLENTKKEIQNQMKEAS